MGFLIITQPEKHCVFLRIGPKTGPILCEICNSSLFHGDLII